MGIYVNRRPACYSGWLRSRKLHNESREPGATLESSGNFHGYIIDGISNPYNPTGGVLVIENLAIINAYEGQNFTATASASWSAGSNVTITVVPPAGVAINCLVYDLSGSSTGPKQTPVFVGVVTTVNAGTSVVVATAAIASLGTTDNLQFVQGYAAGASFSSHATTITMSVSAPAALSGKECLVYDYVHSR